MFKSRGIDLRGPIPPSRSVYWSKHTGLKRLVLPTKVMDTGLIGHPVMSSSRDFNDGLRLSFRWGSPRGSGDWRLHVFPWFLDRASKGSSRAMAWPRQASPSGPLQRVYSKASKCYAHALQHEKPDIPRWSSFTVRLVVCASFHLPKSLQLRSKCSGELRIFILNRRSY